MKPYIWGMTLTDYAWRKEKGRGLASFEIYIVTIQRFEEYTIESNEKLIKVTNISSISIINWRRDKKTLKKITKLGRKIFVQAKN